jgi:hypothetical protein
VGLLWLQKFPAALLVEMAACKAVIVSLETAHTDCPQVSDDVLTGCIVCCVWCVLQIEGDHAMDAVFSSICRALDTAAAKIDDPLEDFCSKNPSDLECLVYDD